MAPDQGGDRARGEMCKYVGALRADPVARGENLPLSSQTAEHRLAAILSADVVGYSRLMSEDEEATVRTLTEYREQVELLVRQHRGRVVDFRGDDFLAEFPAALEAVRCGVEIQRVLEGRNADLAADRRMQFRIGIHLGDVRVEGERIYGDGVNIAARLEGLAAPGGVCISAEVHGLVENKLDVVFRDLGEQSVKNIARPVRVYAAELGAAPETPMRRRSSGVPAALAVLVLAAAALGWWLVVGRGEEPRAIDAGRIRALAVLPLENLSGDPEREYFADGMTEALITTLAKVEALRVISRTSVMQYKRARKPLPEIARELGVDAVVEGSVLYAGDRVRITAQLIDAATDQHLWTESYDRDLGDTLALQSEVARAIAREVQVELTPRDESRLARVRPVDAGAHEAYLTGRYFLWQVSPESLGRAKREFERSIDLDPSYAPAYAGLSDVYYFQSIYGLVRPLDSMPQQKQAALDAVERDETLPEAQISLARALTIEWDWEGAERAYLRVLELNPGNADAELSYASVLANLGRLDEAEGHFRRARELDPMSPLVNAWLGQYLVLSGEPERAIEQLHHTLSLAPDFMNAHLFLGQAYLELGRDADAIAEFRQGMEIGAHEPTLVGALASLLASAGERDEAEALLNGLLAQSRERYVDPCVVGLLYASLGEDDLAFEWAERAYEEHSMLLAVGGAMKPLMRPLHSDPRYADLMRRIGLP